MRFNYFLTMQAVIHLYSLKNCFLCDFIVTLSNELFLNCTDEWSDQCFVSIRSNCPEREGRTTNCAVLTKTMYYYCSTSSIVGKYIFHQMVLLIIYKQLRELLNVTHFAIKDSFFFLDISQIVYTRNELQLDWTKDHAKSGYSSQSSTTFKVWENHALAQISRPAEVTGSEARLSPFPIPKSLTTL